MIREIATLAIVPACAEMFIAAVQQVNPIFLAAPGCHGMALEMVTDDSAGFRLMVDSTKLGVHAIDLRCDAAFPNGAHSPGRSSQPN